MAVVVVARNGGVMLRRLASRDEDRMDMYLSPTDAITVAIDILNNSSADLTAKALCSLCRKLVDRENVSSV